MRGRRPAPSTAPWTCPGPSSWGRSRRPTASERCAGRLRSASRLSSWPRSRAEAPATVRKEEKMNTRAYSLTFISAGLMTLVGLSAAAESKEYLKGDRPQQRGYSEAVITEGGRTVWLAGQTATLDDNGKSLASDFDGQVRQLFKNLDRTLQKAGGKLSDMVQMTVFITDVRYGDRLTQIRREVFGDNFPGSALITITALAVPDAKIEIQGYAVIGGK